MMPGTTTEDVEKHLRKVIKNKNVEIKCLKSKEASKFSPTDSRSFRVIEEICVRADPEVIVAPYLVMGGTDACFYELYAIIFIALLRSMCARSSFSAPMLPMSAAPLRFSTKVCLSSRDT